VAGDPGFARAELSTDWVEESWDGPAERDRVATRAALAAAALEQAAAGGGAGAAGSGSAGATLSRTGWRVAGREEAVDRWPE
jgi:hypothetical protein